ncbi:DDE-type integrase/transposase/recombinase [Flavobacterium sp. FlaQc-52]|jgi:putative transposase|uniref:DDE-type integrase/transposase/recombinase n=1 Tax=Flavobacterium sp. FlaQc-52 TaxID=3374185 RepID=UPI0037567F2A
MVNLFDHHYLLIYLYMTTPEQVWVSDLTYIGKRNNLCYLSLITDACSKKKMEYYVAKNLNTQSCLKALKMALKQRMQNKLPLIHHSDRGLQYC